MEPSVKDIAQKRIFQEQFRLSSENLKTTWKLIDMVINREKSCVLPTITALIARNRCYTNKTSIVQHLIKLYTFYQCRL